MSNRNLLFAAFLAILAPVMVGMGPDQKKEVKESLDTQKALENIKKELKLVDPDKQIQEFVHQAHTDYEIDGTVILLQDENDANFKGCSLTVSTWQEKQNDFPRLVRLIRYFPWDRFVTFDDGVRKKEYVHPQTNKFYVYHEYAHIKNNDFVRIAIATPSIATWNFAQFATSFMGLFAGALLLHSDKAKSIKLFGCASMAFLPWGLGKVSHAESLRLSRKIETEADLLACKTLLKKNDIKPLIHCILDNLFFINNRIFIIKPKATHPSERERIKNIFDEMDKSSLLWTNALYMEIKGELEQDPFKDQKIVYLNKIHRYFIQKQYGRITLPQVQSQKMNVPNIKAKIVQGELPASRYLPFVNQKRLDTSL